MGKMKTEFRVIAGGSVVEERFAGGTPMEMLSTYHDVDGKLIRLPEGGDRSGHRPVLRLV